jgi:hypothetical protein
MLATSLVTNLILLIAWLKTVDEAREWKACARIGFDVIAESDRTPDLVKFVMNERRKAVASRMN